MCTNQLAILARQQPAAHYPAQRRPCCLKQGAAPQQNKQHPGNPLQLVVLPSCVSSEPVTTCIPQFPHTLRSAAVISGASIWLLRGSTVGLRPQQLLLVCEKGVQRPWVTAWRGRHRLQAVLPWLHPANSARMHQCMPCMCAAAALGRPLVIAPMQVRVVYVAELDALVRPQINNPILVKAVVQHHHLRAATQRTLPGGKSVTCFSSKSENP